MSTWLKSQKKADLVELADEAGLKGGNNMKKEDLASALDELLKANAATLSKKTTLSEYYSRVSGAVKEAAASAVSDVEKAAKPRVRRVTKAAGEIETAVESVSVPEAAKAVVKATPKAVARVTNRVSLPSSPSAVTHLVERQSALVSRRVSRYWEKAGITPYLESARASMSTVVGLETGFLLFEAYGLRSLTLPMRLALTVPGNKLLGTGSIQLYFPDFFVLLTSSFWAPSTLWALTSLVLPLVAAWFFNMTLLGTRREKQRVDPLTFNVAKALITWLVYAQGYRFGGLVSDSTARHVNHAIIGGWPSIVIGSAIGALFSVYEAVLRK